MAHQRPPFHLLRSAAVSASVLSLAGWAHVLAGGQLPPVPVMAACAILVLLVAAFLTTRKMTTPALTGVLAAGQILLHEAFSALSHAAKPTADPALHLHGTAEAGMGVPAGPGLHGHPPTDLDPPMLAVHLLATLATAVLLARGEAALWELASWLRPLAGISAVRIPSISTPTVPVPGHDAARRGRSPRRPPLRGPPATSCTSPYPELRGLLPSSTPHEPCAGRAAWPAAVPTCRSAATSHI